MTARTTEAAVHRGHAGHHGHSSHRGHAGHHGHTRHRGHVSHRGHYSHRGHRGYHAGYRHGYHGYSGYRGYSGYGFGYRPFWSSYSYYAPRVYVGFGGYCPSYYPSYYGSYSPYSYRSSYGIGGYSLTLPAQSVVGPQAVKNFLGIAPQPPTAALALAPAVEITDHDAKPVERKVKPQRTSNQVARARAARYLSFGDKRFADQQFHEALQRYKKAAVAAPDIAEPYFRQGQAMVALGQYDQAIAAFGRGLAINREWARSDFRLARLYGDNIIAQRSHLERLAQAAEKAPRDGNLLLLIGIQLHFSDQAKRAELFFRRAAQRDVDVALVEPFLPQQNVAKKPKNVFGI